MSDHLGYDDLRADTVRQVAKLMAASGVTAPKSGGQLFLQGKHFFIETVWVPEIRFGLLTCGFAAGVDGGDDVGRDDHLRGVLRGGPPAGVARSA